MRLGETGWGWVRQEKIRRSWVRLVVLVRNCVRLGDGGGGWVRLFDVV